MYSKAMNKNPLMWSKRQYQANWNVFNKRPKTGTKFLS